MTGGMMYMIRNKANRPIKMHIGIKSIGKHTKGQEQGNMKATERNMSNAERELLYQYEKTGITPGQLNCLLNHLKGECWLCEHSRPYDLSPTRKLSVCELGVREDVIAQIRDKKCDYWRLKHFG